MYDRAAPALSPAEGRSTEILALVRKAFVEKGFDGASMQDLARAAGMSVGNFYRYFPSKDAIVEALVALDMDEVEEEFATISRSTDPMLALRTVLAHRIRCGGCDGDDSVLWAEITAAARRKPRIAEVSARMERAIVEKLVAVFRLILPDAPPAATQHFGIEARMLMMLVKACAMHTGDGSASSVELKSRVQRMIDDLLNSLSKDALQ
jgi:AcrR family transcriptional regulator